MSPNGTHEPDSYLPSEPRRLLYNNSRFTGAMTDDLYMENSVATVLTANTVNLEKSGAGIVIAEKVTAHNTAAFLILAGEIEGEVRPVFSTAAAMMVAGACLLGWALWGRAARRR